MAFDRRQFNIWLSKAEDEELKALAKRLKQPRSTVVKTLVKKELDRIVKESYREVKDAAR